MSSSLPFVVLEGLLTYNITDWTITDWQPRRIKQQLIDEQRKHVSEVRVLIAEREEVQKQKEGISSTMRQSWTSQQATLEEELRVERERARELVLRL